MATSLCIHWFHSLPIQEHGIMTIFFISKNNMLIEICVHHYSKIGQHWPAQDTWWHLPCSVEPWGILTKVTVVRVKWYLGSKMTTSFFSLLSFCWNKFDTTGKIGHYSLLSITMSHCTGLYSVLVIWYEMTCFYACLIP